jgi:hypothetical protein
MPIGLKFKEAYITLPISPRVVFTACYDDSALRQVKEGDQTAIVRRINERVVRQARQYVWGIDDAAFQFVKKHINTLPDWQLISERAKALSAQQARGENESGPAKPPARAPSLQE